MREVMTPHDRLASRIDQELAKDSPKRTLDLRGIHKASIDKFGEPDDGLGILFILNAIRTQLPDVEVIV